MEAIAKVTRNNSLLEDEKIWLSATSRVNDDQIYVTQLALFVKNDFNETYPDNVSIIPVYSLGLMLN